MQNDSNYILSDLLASWHKWAKGWSGVTAHGSCAMFTEMVTSRQWDSSDDLIDGSLHNSKMQAIDFNVGELPPVQRTAIQIQARNLATGVNVWSSARLPTDLEERTIILMEARNALMRRLYSAGVI